MILCVLDKVGEEHVDVRWAVVQRWRQLTLFGIFNLRWDGCGDGTS